MYEVFHDSNLMKILIMSK